MISSQRPSDSGSSNHSYRTVIDIAFGAQTPIDVVVVEWAVHGFLAVVSGTGARAATVLAATIVVRNYVIDTIRRVSTGSYQVT